MDAGKGRTIKSFHDLKVYQNLYQAMLTTLTKILPSLPQEEKYDLKDQMRRCCKAAPALIAEGFAKRYQKRNWHKYIDSSFYFPFSITNFHFLATNFYHEGV